MARIAAKLANFSFNSVQIEDELHSIEMAVDVNLPEVTAFGDTGGTFVEGLPTSRLVGAGFCDFAAGQGDATIFGQIGSGAAAYILDPTGSGPGASAPTFSGSAFVRSYRVRCEIAGPATYDVELQVSGANTRNVA